MALLRIQRVTSSRIYRKRRQIAPTGSSTTWTVSITEAASATDTPSSLAVLGSSIVEAAAATDSPSSTAVLPSTVAEAASATDSPSSAAVLSLAVAESASAVDAPSSTLSLPLSVAEAANATDTPSATGTLTLSVSEAANATDTTDATIDTSGHPGSGKRKGFPSYIPQPAYDEKPSKPFQPIWDRRRREELDRQQQRAIDKIAPPLPPASVFAPPPVPAAAPPSFANLVPPDPMGLAERMHAAATKSAEARDAAEAMSAIEDMSDAIAVLTKLGLLN